MYVYVIYIYIYIIYIYIGWWFRRSFYCSIPIHTLGFLGFFSWNIPTDTQTVQRGWVYHQADISLVVNHLLGYIPKLGCPKIKVAAMVRSTARPKRWSAHVGLYLTWGESMVDSIDMQNVDLFGPRCVLLVHGGPMEPWIPFPFAQPSWLFICREDILPVALESPAEICQRLIEIRIMQLD